MHQPNIFFQFKWKNNLLEDINKLLSGFPTFKLSLTNLLKTKNIQHANENFVIKLTSFKLIHLK